VISGVTTTPTSPSARDTSLGSGAHACLRHTWSPRATTSITSRRPPDASRFQADRGLDSDRLSLSAARELGLVTTEVAR
ncbi:MAG: hypothetical protein MUC82_14365, partial [Cypionkella sp.]|nr:hypothetical protein [Cypionkella sp.]